MFIAWFIIVICYTLSLPLFQQLRTSHHLLCRCLVVEYSYRKLPSDLWTLSSCKSCLLRQFSLVLRVLCEQVNETLFRYSSQKSSSPTFESTPCCLLSNSLIHVLLSPVTRVVVEAAVISCPECWAQPRPTFSALLFPSSSCSACCQLVFPKWKSPPPLLLKTQSLSIALR